jgi:hypothetical protein
MNTPQQAIELAPRNQERRFLVCPFCLRRLAVDFDKKDRPYWRCGWCEVRSFASLHTLETFEAEGIIWKGDGLLKALQGWISRLTTAAGLQKGDPK